LRVIRGTWFDLLGNTHVRRTERRLIGQYRETIGRLIRQLTPDNHRAAVLIAGLPDMVRGYEDVKLANVQKYEAALQDEMQKLNESQKSPCIYPSVVSG
jgi:indolepyruvate ferredoxin oxidoreductase